MHSTDALPTEVARVTDAGTRAVRTLATLRGAPVRAEAAHSTAPTVMAHDRADEGILVRDERSGVGVLIRVAGARAVPPETNDGAKVYPEAGPEDADLVTVPTSQGVEDWVVLPRQPAHASIAYELAMQHVAGLRLVSNVLELLDESGTPRLRARPPYLIDAAGKQHRARFELVDCAADTSATPPWGRPVRAPGHEACRVNVTWGGSHVIYPAALDPIWEATTGNLAKGRRWHTATPLGADPASPMLLTGGFDGGSAVAIAELYQPLSRTFAATGTLNEARGAHAAVALADGSVLVVGGAASVAGDDTSGQLGSLEHYDPATGVFTMLPETLVPPRANLTATLLGNSQVLIAGGQDALGQPLKATAVFDPIGPSLVAGPLLKFARAGHTATAIDVNRVLVVGGFAAVDANAAKTTEIFDAQAPGAFVDGPLMTFSRAYHTATVLDDKRILLAGGISKPNDPIGSKIHETAEVYTPNGAIGTMAVLVSKMSVEHAYHAATKLPTGKVVLSGGFGTSPGSASPHTVRAETELFDPATDTFSTGPSMAEPRLFHTLSSVNPAGSIVNGEPLEAEAALAAGGMPVQGGVGTSLPSAELLLRPLGESCMVDVECASGHCSDSVCCDTACEGECDSCAAALKASGVNDGKCGPSGEGFYAAGMLTGGPDLGTQCINEVVTHYTCDGLGNKKAYLSEPCSGNFCDADGKKCIETCNGPTQCVPSSYCDIQVGKCAPKHGLGEECDDLSQCSSGFCVDEVCCNVECLEICEACNVAGLTGTCSHAGTNGRQAPVGERKCMHSTAPGEEACAGFCDVLVSPSNQDCAYPGDAVLCGEEKTCTCEDSGNCEVGPATQARFACDGDGACGASGVADDGKTYVTDCGGHICGPVSENGHQQCATKCEDDTSCLIDFFCKEGTCEPLPTTGRCDGGHMLRLPGGPDKDCVPYLCPKDQEACAKRCESDADCVETGGPGKNDTVCTPDNKCEPAPKAPVIPPSCSSSSGPVERDLGGLTLLALLLASITVYRIRCRQSGLPERTPAPPGYLHIS